MDLRGKLDDFAAGKLTPSEKEDLRNALAALTEEERMELFPVDAYLQKDRFQLPEEEITAALSRFKQTVKPKGKLIQWKNISRYAAIFILLLGSTFLLRKSTSLFNRNGKATKQFRSMKVADGKQATLVLTDGTRITINGGSELLFPEKFEGTQRIVYLKEGEAYFDIAMDAQHPFIVKSTQLKVQVLGTSFSVRNYSDEKQAAVSVNSGRVAVGQFELIAGTGTILNKHTGALTKQNIDTAATTAWTKGELIFHDADLQQVLQVLQHRYAVRFDVKDSLLMKRRFNATFRNNNIQTIMQQLKLMSNISYTITDDQILIQ
ncbi:FecR family protein [Chitinophaga sp. CF118]|uniref:FecR family protein n=1 Tax=Chitinophaga sp. CF118 TaxID=1884367 RepID=UPI0008EBCBEF|nr:FecR domain-containing protein [Chitinophaga sp. CF118]SFD15086.1 FecR family protein [Chitinophaga sp. CF118]